MAFVLSDAERLVVDGGLVFLIGGSGLNGWHINDVILHANSPEEAYQRAMAPSRCDTSDMMTLRRRRLYRMTFVAAGVYNIVWGVYSALDPQWLFRFSGMEPLNRPEVFVCLAMIVGLYGIVYLEVARRPERCWLMAAVGLVGKILGPMGLLVLIATGAWPVRTFVLCLFNDLIWWLPFSAYVEIGRAHV